MNVVREPKECQSCEKLFCDNCIETWKRSLESSRALSCPHCKAVTEMKQPNRIVMKFYNEIKIHCTSCNVMITQGEIE